jgi:hypothetical protein
MQLNSQKSFNYGTKENKNEVVVIEGTQGDVESVSLGGLAYPGDKISLSSGSTVVELCSINTGVNIDNARVSIYKSGGSSGCSGRGPSPTLAPPSPTPASANLGITKFKFINTATNNEVSADCSSCLGNTANLGVVAEYWGNVRSVQFILSGARTRTHKENSMPFSLFGDSGWNKIFPGILPSGSYTLECTAYSQSNLRGEASATKTLDFVIS